MANPAEVLLYGVDDSLKSMETLVSVGVTMTTAGTESTLMVDYEKSKKAQQDTTRFRAALLGPVYLDVSKLVAFIKHTGLQADDSPCVQGLKKSGVLVGCKAFFYDSGAQSTEAFDKDDPDTRKQASVAMLLTVETGGNVDIIGSFITDKSVRDRVAELFELNSLSLRILRSPDAEGMKAIQRYAAELKGKALPPPAPLPAPAPSPAPTGSPAPSAAPTAKPTT